MVSRRKRVEQKGRFTITEIIPGSPYSSNLSSPKFLDDEVAAVEDEAPISAAAAGHHNTITIVPNGLIELKVEEPAEIPTQTTVEAAVVSIEASLIIVPETKAAVATDSNRQLLTSTAQNSATPGSGSLARKYTSPKKSREGVQRARRIKRRGRFTIIEMAFDSPTSRKNSDELSDHRFVTTTSVGGSSAGSPPQQLICSLDTVERRTKPKRGPRSMPRLRQPPSVRRSRRRSESLTREFSESMDLVDPIRNQQHQHEVAACAELQDLSLTESTTALDSVALTSAMAGATGATATPCANALVPTTGLPILDSDSTIAATTSAFRPATLSSQQTNGSIVGLPKSSSISTAQFLQQQQTIASLIRQQHDLKQIIGVLQEQQQQLMSIPSYINELESQSASINSGRSRDDETQKLCMKVRSLTRANESLHSMLSAAEREVRHRKLQIDCLSEENDDLRQRCGQLELLLQPRD